MRLQEAHFGEGEIDAVGAYLWEREEKLHQGKGRFYFWKMARGRKPSPNGPRGKCRPFLRTTFFKLSQQV